MESGKVKWFNDSKGFGFIVPETGGDDIFVHYSEIQSEGHKTLKDNQKVQYHLDQSQKGLKATNVVPC